MKKLVLVCLLVLLTGQVAGEVQHELYADRDRAWVNSTVKLDCSSSCPVSQWELAWKKPRDAKIVSIRDSIGKVTDYRAGRDEVVINTNDGPPRESEVLEIKMLVDREAEKVYKDLFKRTLSLPGLEGEETYGFVSSPDLLSGWTGFGFRESFTGDRMNFRGSGPVNLRIKFGKGSESEHFEFFGEKPEGTATAYRMPVGTTGITQRFERFPVAVMTDESYDREVNGWSAGEYVGGAIRIRSPGSAGDDFLPVLAHEVVHGLNDRELDWDSTSSTYFDEGTSKYVEFLVKRQLYREERIEQPPAELFGGDVRYGKYVLPPKGDRERLWSYYQDDREFMKNWDALGSSRENRGFGYAYSELIIRNYVARMNGSLDELYRELDVDREIESPAEKWRIYSRHLDMRPCDYSSRKRFDRCLDTIIEYDYPVYSAVPVGNSSGLELERLEVPNRTRENGSVAERSENVSQGISGFIGDFFRYLLSLLRALAASL